MVAILEIPHAKRMEVFQAMHRSFLRVGNVPMADELLRRRAELVPPSKPVKKAAPIVKPKVQPLERRRVPVFLARP